MNNINIKIIQKKIKSYYTNNARVLPWRVKNGQNQNAYETLISEIMLQQTRVATVLKYYKNFLRKFKSLRDLALASRQEVLKSWSGMGYYRRAINLHKTAKLIYREYDGKIPSEKSILKKLPGIGEYTSSAIASFAYGKDEVVIDTNIERFISRIFSLNISELRPKNIKLMAKILFPKKEKGSFAQAIMDFSNDYCLKLSPRCNVCILSKDCNYEDSNQISNTKKKDKRFCTSYFIFNEKKMFFVRRRPVKMILGGMYELPSSEWHKKNITKKFFLNIDNTNNIFHSSIVIKHEFSHFILFSRIVILNVKNIKDFKLKGRWVNKNSLKNLPLSSLTKKIVNHSLAEFSSLNKFL